MTSGQILTLVQELGLSNLSKRLSSVTIASILRVLDGFNVVSRANNNYGDSTYTFFIMPTIRYVISGEKLNAIYSYLTQPQEEEPTSSLFDMADQGGNQ